MPRRQLPNFARQQQWQQRFPGAVSTQVPQGQLLRPGQGLPAGRCLGRFKGRSAERSEQCRVMTGLTSERAL